MATFGITHVLFITDTDAVEDNGKKSSHAGRTAIGEQTSLEEMDQDSVGEDNGKSNKKDFNHYADLESGGIHDL